MNKRIVFLVTLVALAQIGFGQTTQEFGKADIAELQMKQCEFEKDANAMVLFSKANVYFDSEFNILSEQHKRIKIFSEKGKDEANIRIEFFSGGRYEFITNVQAQTINLKDGKPEVIKLEKKLIYTEVIDKSRSAIVFSFPNVQPGSIIEYKYIWHTLSYGNFPDWQFQEGIPVGYSELTTSIPEMFYYKVQSRIRQGLAKNQTTTESRSLGSGIDAQPFNVETQVRALENIPSLRDEPYMSSRKDNVQAILFQLNSVRPFTGFVRSYSDSWAAIGGILADDEDFGVQFKKKLTGEEIIVAKAKTLRTDQQKIAYVFNEVKERMKWNGVNRWYTNEGTSKSWDTKTGNSAEINLILFHLLKQSGLNAYPMIVSTRNHGKVNTVYPSLYQFNKAVTYIPVDSTQYYILDATDKYHTFNEIPDDLLNSSGLYIDKDKKVFDLLYITNPKTVRTSILINAAMTADGKVNGNANITAFSYHRLEDLKELKANGEEKFKDYLAGKENGLKIVKLKVENADIDTLPLAEIVDFSLDLNSDGDYIFFKPNLFNPMGTNPFLSENRLTDVYFSHKDNFSIYGLYKLPAGFKAEALPKSVSMNTPDQGIAFRRLVAEADGVITFRYTIDFKKVIFFKENYPDLREFYRKLYELMNEQVVLKKSS